MKVLLKKINRYCDNFLKKPKDNKISECVERIKEVEKIYKPKGNTFDEYA